MCWGLYVSFIVASFQTITTGLMYVYQLTSDELHERQKQQPDITGPIVVAVSIRDAANIGSILRVCDAISCQLVYLVDTPNADSRRIRKVSRSVNKNIKHHFVTLAEFRELSLEPLIAIEITSDSTDLYATELPKNGMFVIGNERYGIPDEVLAMCSSAVHIPMFGVNSSMNVATSLGIVLYEWYRQVRTS